MEVIRRLQMKGWSLEVSAVEQVCYLKFLSGRFCTHLFCFNLEGQTECDAAASVFKCSMEKNPQITQDLFKAVANSPEQVVSHFIYALMLQFYMLRWEHQLGAM
jgi:hypothetical protein